MDGGNAVCFGFGGNGRLGTEDTATVGDSTANDLSKGIVKLPAQRTAVSISVGSAHTCAVMDDGNAVCFGLGNHGRLGTEDTAIVGDSTARDLSKGIVKLPAQRSVVSISVGSAHTCAVMDDGNAVCFGFGGSGCLGTEDTANVGDSATRDLGKGIVKLSAQRSVVSISAGDSHTCAVMDDGNAVCFGGGGDGRLGTEDTANVGDSTARDLSKGIVKLPAQRSVVSISAGDSHTCAVMDDGNAVCFGFGGNGRLGTEDTANVGDSATRDLGKGIVKLPAQRSVVSISAGTAHTCAVMDDGNAVCFGFGGNGCLGTEDTANVGDSATRDLSKGIVKLPAQRSVVSISAGDSHTCAVMDDGNAVCFGFGGDGRLGTEDTTNVGDSTARDLGKGNVLFPTVPSPSPTSSPSPTVSPTTTGTPSPSSSVSPTTTATPSPSSSVSPTTTATPSPSPSPAIGGLGNPARGASTNASGIGAGPITAVTLLAVAVLGAVALTVHQSRRRASRKAARTARSVPTGAASV